MKKYKNYVFIIFLSMLIGVNIISAKSNKDMPLLGKIIYIDPGHGGIDPGAMYKNIMEKDINLEISLLLEKKLDEAGAIVYLTRYGDYDLATTYTNNNKRSDLSRRSNLIKKADADLTLSIHLNAENTGVWQGAQVFYNDKNPDNKIIADLIQKNFIKKLNSKRKSKVDNQLYLLKRIDSPAVLLELGFLSNSNDRYLLKQSSYQNKIVKIIQESIIEFFNK